MYNYVSVTIEANDLHLIIDEFTSLFNGFISHGAGIDKAEVRGYITPQGLKALQRKVTQFATANITVEELIKC